MNLAAKQRLFSRLVARFITEITARGYEVSLGEAWRPPETARLYQSQGKGITNSLHTIRLAIDLNLFKDGKWLQTTREWQEAGELWESYSGSEYECSWGGRFGDGNHLSISHQGVR